MPIYEYKCQSCGHRMEAIQKMADDPLKDCPECNDPSLTKLISATAFRLKGSGWYETDFKSGEKKNLAGSDKNDSKPAEKKKEKEKAKTPAKSTAKPTSQSAAK